MTHTRVENIKIDTENQGKDEDQFHPESLLKNAKTVISYFISFTILIVESNNNDDLSSLEWVTTYIETNKLLSDLGLHLKTII